jgi:O-antigen ligase
MSSKSLQNYDNLLYVNFIHFLIALFPLSYIAGNLIINLNVLLVVVTTLIIFKKKVFFINYNIIDKLIFFAFAIIVISGIINTFQIYLVNENSIQSSKILIKSFLHLRYLLFYLILRFLVEKNIFNFRIFFISSFICSLFVSIDLIYQLIFGVDILGFKPDLDNIKLSGPFGDELIAGSYLQKFGFLSFFFIPLFLNIKYKKLVNLYLILLFLLILFSLIITGNRMPFILFVFIMFSVFILEKKTRKYFISLSTITILVFLTTYKYNTVTKYYFNNFFKTAIEIKDSTFNFIFKDLSNEELKLFNKDPQLFIPNTYVKEFYSGVATWKQNKIIGGGVDSFYVNCKKSLNDCASHPHNYYLEILSEIGIVGLIIFLLIFGKVFLDTFYLKYLKKAQFNNLIIPFMFLFLAEIFPIKTSGSFFTTSNASFIFFILAITVALSKRPN